MMLSHINLERLIAEKKLEIEKEKIDLGFETQQRSQLQNVETEVDVSTEIPKKLRFQTKQDLTEDNAATVEEKKEIDTATERDLDENIPPDLERYIRRYLGLPVMLKAGEYSPNNPLVRCERSSGDVLLALGEYERRRNTLRRMRQQQYREYLDQQAKKKQEAKEQAERERREREEREREREEREREREEREREQRERDRRLVERERRSPDRRPSVSPVTTHPYTSKKDTAVQVDSVTSPLSVAVQTDDADLFRIATSKCQLTQAERELSPHTVVDPSERPIHPASWAVDQAWNIRPAERRRSYGDFDDRSLSTKRSNHDKLVSDLRHSYMPSIFDADAIQLRNLQAEKEAAARRQFYQQELKNQIMEQQRIKEERKSREKMLEQAEMRRLEEQLKMLRTAQDTEVDKQQRLDDAMKKDSIDYQKHRADLQNQIDLEQQKLRVPLIQQIHKRTESSRSEDTKLPVFYPKIQERYPNQDKKPHSQDRTSTYQDRIFTSQDRFSVNQERRVPNQDKKPFSTNIPDNSIFSPNYDVDSYLRKNLNFKDRYGFDIESIGKERATERVLIHERPKRVDDKNFKVAESVDCLPIPVLKHSPVVQSDKVDSDMSEAMKKVNDKWEVPVVQKNILKSIPNNEGKNVNILTQLGSIRRQLQLEQLRLDQMSKDK